MTTGTRADPHLRRPSGTALALSAAARRVGAVWRSTGDPDARTQLAVAMTLTVHAALDAMLTEPRRGHRVRDRWRDGSVFVRAARTTARLDLPLPPDLEVLCDARQALGRSAAGPHTDAVRAWLEKDGVDRALALLDHFERLCAMPPPRRGRAGVD